MSIRKIGGIRWIAIGSLRIAICWKRKRKPAMPNVNQYPLEFV